MSHIVLKMTKFSRWAESIFNWIRNHSDKGWTDPRRRCECSLDMSMKVRKQFTRVSFLFPALWVPRIKFSCQAWWQMNLPTEQSCWFGFSCHYLLSHLFQIKRYVLNVINNIIHLYGPYSHPFIRPLFNFLSDSGHRTIILCGHCVIQSSPFQLVWNSAFLI